MIASGYREVNEVVKYIGHREELYNKPLSGQLVISNNHESRNMKHIYIYIYISAYRTQNDICRKNAECRGTRRSVVMSG